MNTGFHIDHQCPQCGAPAVLDETDRLFTCEYCRVRSYLICDDYFRYILPHKAEGQDLIFFPYWRFKGTLFSCTAAGIDEHFIDTSIQGTVNRHFPPSIGLRAQTLNLQFATPDINYEFIKPSVSVADMTELVLKKYSDSPAEKHLHQKFIGETLSLVYSPFYVKDKLYDGVINSPVSSNTLTEFNPLLLDTEKPHWPVNFVPTICPHCGWDLAGERDSLVLVCSNCKTLWKSAGDQLLQVLFGCLPSEFKPDSYLPFWRMSTEVTGLSLSSYADLVRVANLPKVVQDSWESRQFHFWSPAFKIRPRLFMRLSRNLSLAQPEATPEVIIPTSPIHPITLPLQEAIESARITLASLMNPPAKLRHLLPGITITPLESQLVLIPFQDKRHELSNPEFHLAVNHNVLKFAGSL